MKHIKMSKIENEILRYFLSGTVLLMYGCGSILSSSFKFGTENLQLIMMSIMLFGLILRIVFAVLLRKNIIEIEEMNPKEEVIYYYTQGIMLSQTDFILVGVLFASFIVSLLKTDEIFNNIKFVEVLAVVIGIIEINKGMILSNEMKNENFNE